MKSQSSAQESGCFKTENCLPYSSLLRVAAWRVGIQLKAMAITALRDVKCKELQRHLDGIVTVHQDAVHIAAIDPGSAALKQSVLSTDEACIHCSAVEKFSMQLRAATSWQSSQSMML